MADKVLHLPVAERLHDRVGGLVAASGRARIARAPGITRETLRRFLRGGSPSPRTQHRLFRFVVASALAGDEVAQRNFNLSCDLVSWLPEAERGGALVRLTDSMHLVFQDQTGSSPCWLRRISAALDQLCELRRLDDAVIAALLDGRLAGAERDGALAAVADGSEEQFRVFADSARLRREQEESDERT